MNKPKKKIDYQHPDWVDRFNDDFHQIQGVIELACAAEFSPVPANREKVGVVLNDTLKKLDRMNDLVQEVWESIRLSLHPKLSPEVEKKRKVLVEQRDKEYVMVGSKVMNRFNRKIQALERRTP